MAHYGRLGMVSYTDLTGRFRHTEATNGPRKSAESYSSEPYTSSYFPTFIGCKIYMSASGVNMVILSTVMYGRYGYVAN